MADPQCSYMHVMVSITHNGGPLQLQEYILEVVNVTCTTDHTHTVRLVVNEGS